MLLGYDHGLGVTFDGGKAWYRPDNMPMGQTFAIDYDYSFPYRVAGGLQDNGSLMGPSTKKGGAAIRMEDWTTVGGGDGMYNVFDKKTNRYPLQREPVRPAPAARPGDRRAQEHRLPESRDAVQLERADPRLVHNPQT